MLYKKHTTHAPDDDDDDGDYKLINPLIARLKPQSNGPSYGNTVIGTLAVDGWAVTFGTARRGLGGAPVYQLRIIRRGTIIAFGV